ncbi:MAG TPA: nucleoside triphosphate pyrophosphohydrolase [Clostridiales bacterium]|nr:nucleoside triphosphate pyrophosphohydrolase [Clostridiales bacterium]
MKNINKVDVKEFLTKESCLYDYSKSLCIYNVSQSDFEKLKEKLINDFDNDIEIICNLEDGEVKAYSKDLIYAKSYTIEGSHFLDRKHYTFTDLVDLMGILRSENGCPWDRVQTNDSIKSNVIEEAYELVEAIEKNDKESMIEEAGDVLLQTVFHSKIAKDKGLFSLTDVINALCTKLITRHTHVFGETKTKNSNEAISSWEKAKSIEKSQKTVGDKLDSVPKTFGSVMRAHKVQKIVRKTGFDFDDAKSAKQKIFEELDEIEKSKSRENLEWEAGDVLFAAVNYIRMLGVDPEIALNNCTSRFIERFKHIEKKALENNVELKHKNMDILEKYYQDSKRFENQVE